MNDDTTIIIKVYNQRNTIEKTLTLLKDYAKKYHNIRQIILIDFSIDGTKEKIQEQIKNQNKFLYQESQGKEERYVFWQTINQTKTENIITIEAELYTRLHQIQRQIQKLRRTCFLLPSRLHDKSKTRLKDKKELLRIQAKNLLIQTVTGMKYTDMTNPNRGMKKSKLQPLMSLCRTEDYWTELIYKAKTNRIRITETSTHYVQEENKEKDFLETVFSQIKTLVNMTKEE